MYDRIWFSGPDKQEILILSEEVETMLGQSAPLFNSLHSAMASVRSLTQSA
jgi:hypothetical protein